MAKTLRCPYYQYSGVMANSFERQNGWEWALAVLGGVVVNTGIARLVLDCKDGVGESIVWSTAEAALYWVDILGSRIHRLEPDSGRHDVWPTPELPTSIGLTADGGFIVGLRRRVTRWRPGGTFNTLAVPEPDLPGNRLN